MLKRLWNGGVVYKGFWREVEKELDKTVNQPSSEVKDVARDNSLLRLKSWLGPSMLTDWDRYAEIELRLQEKSFSKGRL